MFLADSSNTTVLYKGSHLREWWSFTPILPVLYNYQLTCGLGEICLGYCPLANITEPCARIGNIGQNKYVLKPCLAFS
jgi:hypothetical protein